MRQIRKSVFETNSSSTHVIAFSIKDVKELNFNNIQTIEGKNIFSDYFVYTGDLKSKVSLLVASMLRGLYNIPVMNVFLDEIVEGKLPYDDDFDEDGLNQAVCEYTTGKIKEWIKSPSYDCFIKALLELNINLTNTETIFLDLWNRSSYNNYNEDSKIIDYPLLVRGLDDLYDYINFNDTPENWIIRLRNFIEGKVELDLDFTIEEISDY